MQLEKMTKKELIELIEKKVNEKHNEQIELENLLDCAIDGIKCANNLLNDLTIYLQACKNIGADVDYEAIIAVCGVNQEELKKYLDNKNCPAHNNNFSDQNVFGEDIEFEENCDCGCDCEECKNK